MGISIQKKILLISYLMVAVAATTVLMTAAAAETYTVGDNLGWSIPPLGDVAYKTWAGLKDFSIGDTVVFQWNNTHTVAQVSKSEYDDCTATNTIGQVHTSSPYSVVLNSTDRYYFICTVDGHCRSGQKVTVQVGAAASSLAAGAFSAVFLALAISLLSLV